MQLADQDRARASLSAALDQFSREELAEELGVGIRTLERYELDTIPNPRMVSLAIRALLAARARPEPATAAAFTFIDLFAGIGGTRLGFEQAGGACVFTSEYDKYCVQTYKANHRPSHEVVGDIREVTKSTERIRAMVPQHDVLVAGFPCQPFSIAGVSKKNALGNPHGFECRTQGTLFFDICKIIEAKKPHAFLLENVRNLRSHDKGRTFQTILDALHELGYHVEYRILDAASWVPQHRERIFIVGFRQPTGFRFEDLQVPDQKPKLGSILHPENGSESPEALFTTGVKAKVATKYTLTEHLWQYLKDYRDKHAAAGNGFGYSKVGKNHIARTLSARYYKDGSEILVDRGGSKVPRRLTPRECARLMGFPDSFQIKVSDTQAYKQFGNSVVVPVVAAIAKAMMPHVVALKQASEAAEGQAILRL
jgi:DNA (cytosine-5)-methyltransferase 1